MSGLNLDSMDLFNKKTVTKRSQVPVNNLKIEDEVEKLEPVKVKAISRVEEESPTEERPVLKKSKFKSKSKYDKYTPVTTRIGEDLYMELKKIENHIMRSRSKKSSFERERITSNSILRCLIASFIEREELIDFSEVQNEKILSDRIESIFR